MNLCNCPECGKSDFTAHLKNVRNLNSPVSFICCTGCGAVIGVKDAVDTQIALEHINSRIDELINQLSKTD